MAAGPPHSAASLPPSKYRVLLELGEGGMANVYLAVAQGPSGFNKLVVLKALKTHLAGDPDFRRMFLNEARLSARLHHPNIVQVNEVIEYDGLPFIVMEYLEGKPLSEVRSRAGSQLDLPMHLRIISEALSGLHYSHELADYDGTPLNVVHRDFTPHNIFVTYDGQVKVLDFGIAKLSGSMVETRTGVIKGKVRYMAPEQITGHDVDRRADIFAAGVVIWEAVARTRMWKGMSEPLIMNCLLSGTILKPSSVRPDVAADLDSICMKALAREPDDRYATMAELQSDIDAYLGHFSATISTRNIGQFALRLFEESRVQTRKAIEQHLSKATLNAGADPHAISMPPSQFSKASHRYSASSISRSVAFEDDTVTPVRRRPSRLMLLFGGAAAVAIAGAIWWQLGSDDVTAPASGDQSAVPPSAVVAQNPAADPPMQQVVLRVTVFPLVAQILIDGRPVPSNPYTARVTADKGEHRIEANAEGYVSASTTTTFERNVDLVLTLDEQKAARRSGVVRRAPAPAAPVVAPPREPPPPPKPAANCSPPFYVDERGVKKFKPACL